MEEYEWNRVPIPDEALPPANEEHCAGTYYDGHMVVCYEDMTFCWDFYQAKKCNGILYASTVRKWDMNSGGLNDPYDAWGQTRACSGPNFSGLITYKEVVTAMNSSNRGLSHAVMIAWGGARNTEHFRKYPCGSNTTYVGAWPDKVVRMGQSFQLDPTIDCASLGCGDVGEIICRTLQKKGAIWVDNTDNTPNVSMYFESLEDKAEKWDDICQPYSALSCISPQMLIPVERATDPQEPLGIRVAPEPR